MFQRLFYKLFGRKYLKDKTNWRGCSFELTHFPMGPIDLSKTAVFVRLLVEGDYSEQIEIQMLCGRSLVPLMRVKDLHNEKTCSFAGRLKANSGLKVLDLYVKTSSSRSFSYLGSRMFRGHNSPKSSQKVYNEWIGKYDRLNEQDRVSIRNHIARFKVNPLISVVVPVYNTPEHYLRAAIDSVRAQLYTNWELCLADDASPKPHVKKMLADYEQADKRIRVVYRTENGHISASSNSAMQIAKGEFIALMDHDDLLPERALYEVAWEVNKHPEVDVIYTDEDIIDDQGRRHTPHFKTDLNPQLLLSQNMISHLGVYRRSLVEKVGGFRLGFEGSQDHDLALRTIAETTPEKVRHIPQILYHWRQNGADSSFSNSFLEQCIKNSRRAVQESLLKRSTGYETAKVIRNFQNRQFMRVRFQMPILKPNISLLVRSHEGGLNRELENCVYRLNLRSLLRIRPENTEILIEFDRPDKLSLPLPKVTWLGASFGDAWTRPNGDVLIFINPLVECNVNFSWMDELVSTVLLPDIGIVGPKLLSGDGTVYSAGQVLGLKGNEYGRGADEQSFGFFAHLILQRNVSAVSPLCWAIRREVYEEAGGLNFKLATFEEQTLDLCLRVGKTKQIVWTPYAQLLVRNVQENVKEALVNTTGSEIVDPFYNPNLSLQPGVNGTVELAFPPRRKPSWN